jgi:hypothetical protein
LNPPPVVGKAKCTFANEVMDDNVGFYWSSG